MAGKVGFNGVGQLKKLNDELTPYHKFYEKTFDIIKGYRIIINLFKNNSMKKRNSLGKREKVQEKREKLQLDFFLVGKRPPRQQYGADPKECHYFQGLFGSFLATLKYENSPVMVNDLSVIKILQVGAKILFVSNPCRILYIYVFSTVEYCLAETKE